MGHAGALTLHGADDVEQKVRALRDAGVRIAPSAHLVGETMREIFPNVRLSRLGVLSVAE